MAEKRRGLGRGLGALIPQSTKNSGNAEAKAVEKTAAVKTAPKKVSTPIEEPMTDGLFEMAHEAKPEKQRKSAKAESVEAKPAEAAPAQEKPVEAQKVEEKVEASTPSQDVHVNIEEEIPRGHGCGTAQYHPDSPPGGLLLW